MIFTEGEIVLEPSPQPQKFFSTTVTNEHGEFTHLHCLITYECVTPSIIISSKDRVSSLKSLSYVIQNNISDDSHSSYIPIALCLVTSSRYIDVFRDILVSLNLFLQGISSIPIKVNSIVMSVEFMRAACLILNDLVIPPYDVEVVVKIGGNDIIIPVESNSGLLHTEKCIAVLLDLIDIRNIIELWECLLLNKHAFLRSCNEYLLYLILEAFKELLFPLKWSLYIVPVLGPKLIEYLSSPVPILIGINSNLVSIEAALKENPSAAILDIDSNILYNSSTSLCDCQAAIISKKLQLVKAYYYVNKNRLSTYRMNSLENNIDDEEFVQTAKTLLTANPHDRERIFIALIRHIFLDFFIRGLGKFNRFFTYESFEEKFEFNTASFLQSVKKCEECKMEEFWKEFVESSTFQQFLEFEGKCDDSYYKRYFGILKSIKAREYKICNTKANYVFGIERGLSPRQLMRLIKQSKDKKITDFLSNSITILRREICNNLKIFKEYYRNGESMGRYQHPKNTQDCYHLYYGKFGIIRVTSLLLGHVEANKFSDFSVTNESILPRLENEADPKAIWEAKVLYLHYLIKDGPNKWDFDKIEKVIRILNDNEAKIHSVYQLIGEIMNEIMGHSFDVISGLVKAGGKVGFLAKLLLKQHCSRMSKARSHIIPQKDLKIDTNILEDKQNHKVFTPACAAMKFKRKLSLFFRF